MYNYQEEISERLADVINDIGSIENIDLLDNQSDFLIDLVNSNYIELKILELINKDKDLLKTLEKNIEAFNYKISNLNSIDFNYSFDKLKLMIDNDIIGFNNDNFNYIKDKSIDLLVLFINLNQEFYIDSINDFDIENISNELIKNTKLEEDVKTALFENEKISNSMLEINLLYDLALNNKYYLRNQDSNNLIFNSNIDNNKKFHYLNNIKEELNNDEINDYLCKINSNFNFIGIGNNNFSIDFDQNLLEILKKLESESVISSFALTTKNKIMVYNRKK